MHPGNSPFFSIISVCRNDAWSLSKSSRSVFCQAFKDFEYLIVDGASTDGTAGLVEFWQANGLVSHAVSEPDTGVYNAMNKALRLACGQYVCFLNTGDVFASNDVLTKVHALLQGGQLDGLLGWGELNGQVWASWAEHEAFKLSSLGFCHQSLFVKRSLLLAQPFDERPIKTDSDTLQIGRLFAAGARIAIIPEVLAVRGGEPGISANLDRTKASIVNTLVEEYPPLSEETAEQIIAFRRVCAAPREMCDIVLQSSAPLRTHLAYMVLDTLFLQQSAKLTKTEADALFDCARDALADSKSCDAVHTIERLLHAQGIRQSLMADHVAAAKALQAEISIFNTQEVARLEKLRATADNFSPETGDFVVSLTSFPARLPTLHFVIRSLLEQTCRPREIHVWLGADEIPNRKWLPKALLEFEAHGLQVHFVRQTFHQYDKFLHNAELNKEKPFVIVDDDVIYPPNSMACLLEGHRAHPRAVIANRCHLMGISAAGQIQPYRDWPHEIQVSRPNLRAFPTGAGGVLYPPGFMSDPMVTQISDVLAHAPYADDVWLKACALARGIPTMTTPLSQGAKWYHRYTPTMRAGALHATNIDLGLNDIQIRRSTDWLARLRPNWRQELLADPVK